MTHPEEVTRLAALASVLVDLEYEPGVFVRDEDSLHDFAVRLYAAGVRVQPEPHDMIQRTRQAILGDGTATVTEWVRPGACWYCGRVQPEPQAGDLRAALERIAASPCRDFAPPATCHSNDGTGLWCDPCLARAVLQPITEAATEPEG